MCAVGNERANRRAQVAWRDHDRPTPQRKCRVVLTKRLVRGRSLVVARGPRPAFEMEQGLPGADPDDPIPTRSANPTTSRTRRRQGGVRDPDQARRGRSALPGRACASRRLRVRSQAQGGDPGTTRLASASGSCLSAPLSTACREVGKRFTPFLGRGVVPLGEGAGARGGSRSVANRRAARRGGLRGLVHACVILVALADVGEEEARVEEDHSSGLS